jgi:hypothetical protein
MSRIVLLMFAFAVVGCGTLRDPYRKLITPAKAGLNTRDLIDPSTQGEVDRLLKVTDLTTVSNQVREAVVAKANAEDPARVGRPAKNVLCLSGGGSFGAFSAGLLVGWTASGERPVFDVVTGISTGALIAPLAFIGPKYDADVTRFYTDIRTKDVYVTRAVRGLLGESLADNKPLADKVEEVLTPTILCEIAEAHRNGRRLYIGTTELEGKRFIVWDIGAIAVEGGEKSKDLIRNILLGSSAIPGFFPSSKIPITVDGKAYIEKHGDGGVSQAIFFRPPQPDAGAIGSPLPGTNVWTVVAGKLYADPSPLKSISLAIAGNSVSTVIYSQTRGDLQRIFSLCLLSGMNYYNTSIPEGFDAPKSAAQFEREPMTKMYEEGYRLALSGKAWRKTPPGFAPNETVLDRASVDLKLVKRGAEVDTTQPAGPGILSPGPLPIPAVPGGVIK